MKRYIPVRLIKKSTQCPEFPYFGAWYNDATCINGFLWDLDKFEDGKLYGGGEVPCPFCNTRDFVEYHHNPTNGDTKYVLREYLDLLKAKYVC